MRRSILRRVTPKRRGSCGGTRSPASPIAGRMSGRSWTRGSRCLWKGQSRCWVARRGFADLHHPLFLDRRARWRGYCAIPRLASCSMNTSPRTALSSSHTPAGLALRASCRRRSRARINPVRAASGSRCAIPPASLCSGRGARFGTDELEPARARSTPPSQQADGVGNHPCRPSAKLAASRRTGGRKSAGPREQ
jgi:hypothetical protein